MSEQKVRLSAALHPFKSERKDFIFDEGATIQEMLDEAQPDKKQLKNALVFVRGELVPRKVWHGYKPKPGTLIEARAFAVPQGGGGDSGGKNVLRVVASLAVIAVAAWAGPAVAGALIPTAGVATAGTALAIQITGALLTATIGAVGMLAINAIAPVRTPQLADLSNASGQSSDSPTLFIEGARNALRPFAPVPQVLGKYRMTPSYGSKPYTESLGDQQHVRMLFVWGIGPLAIDTSSLKIGETLLSEFEDYQIEHREGYDSDTPLTLFPSVVHQEDLTVLLDQSSSWVTRTTEPDCDEISVDLTFPQGLTEFNNRGGRSNRSVKIEIEYMVTGTSPEVWEKIDPNGDKFQSTIPSSWMVVDSDGIDSITFTHKRTSAVRHGIRWGVDTREQYDIRVRRITTDTNSTLIIDKLFLTAIRSITDEDPINSPVPLAVTALVIKASDQLNGIVDEFNGVVTTVCNDFTDPTWTEQESQNPAALFRHILQGNGMVAPLPDSRIDIDKLEEWYAFCEGKGFKFNMVRDFKSSVWDALADVASAGRAAPTMRDGKWSVVIEEEQALSSSFVCPRNSWDFKAQKFFITQPHAWRIPFINENEGYRLDERRVFQDGYNEGNATIYESVEFPGVTDPDQIYKLGRFRIAQTILQPERWTFKQDMAYLTYERGSRITINHDVLLVGLKYGRLKTVTLTGSPAVEISEVTLDEEVVMEAGKNYGISIRGYSGQVTAQVVTAPGSTKMLTLTTPIAGIGSPLEAAAGAGDLFGFGLLGQETDEASVISIIPDSNLRAQVTAVPYRAAIFDADSEIIPEFTTNLTPLRGIPAPEVQSVVSDESALTVGAGDILQVRIHVAFTPLNEEIFGQEAELRVQMRPSGTEEPFSNAPLNELQKDSFFIIGVRTGETWDIRLRYIVPGKLPGPWAVISNHLVVGKSTAPQPLSGLTISTFGAQALIRWDKPAELDVLFGGEVVFRHTPSMSSPSLTESVTIGESSLARQLWAVLPLKEGTYFAVVYDVAGNAAATATYVSTKQASVHTFASVDTIDEDPDFLGTHNGTVESANSLTIDEDDSDSNGALLEGTYEFASGIDLSTVQKVRLTTRLAVTIFDTTSTMDERVSLMDDWDDFDQSSAMGADAFIYERHTDDDPTGSPDWSEWNRLDSAEFEARAFEFYIALSRNSTDYNILVSDLGVDVEDIA